MTTDENDIILDLFLGTGTTAIAAKRLGRKYIGFEIDREYINVSKEKLKHTKTNFKLNDIWVSYYLNEIVTIRNLDWGKIKDNFIIPDSVRKIDYEKIKLKNYFKQKRNYFYLFD